jgi:hypothetical protein
MTKQAMDSYAGDLAALLEAEGLPQPPLPAEIMSAMRAHGPGCFASDELQGDERADMPLRKIASRWLDAGSPRRGARCEFIGRGFRSNFVQVVFESPRCGVFLSKVVSQAFDDAIVIRRRVEGTFTLMRSLLEATERAAVWPAGKRLAIIDDDKDGLLRWGWVAEKGVRRADLAHDDAGWILALSSVEELATSVGARAAGPRSSPPAP